MDLSLDIIRAHPPRSVTYIALGPLTNLARMMRLDAACVRERIGRIVAMGGAFEAPGNVTPVAECRCSYVSKISFLFAAVNFYADPFAVRELLYPSEPSKGLPLDRFILLPLDLTTDHELPFSEYRKWVDPAFSDTLSPSESDAKSPLTHFTSSFLERTAEVPTTFRFPHSLANRLILQVMRGFGVDAVQLHDPITVWCAICNPPMIDNASLLRDGWVARKRKFQIER